MYFAVSFFFFFSCNYLICYFFSGKSHKNKGKNSKNKKYTKDQIGCPQNFIHVQHIGWNKDKGFDLGKIKDPQLNKFFAKVWWNGLNLIKSSINQDILYFSIKIQSSFCYS